MAEEQSPRRDQLAEEPLEEVAAGLPADARARLEEMRAGQGLFTSDLTVNEFVLIGQAGFRPRGLVLGSSIYKIGITGRLAVGNRELGQLSQAMYSARERAMARMEAEAAMLGADGIVGVRLAVKLHEWGKHLAEFIAIGTAVSAEVPGEWRTQGGNPFTSDLSGQDFWALLRSGWAPVGLVMGTCVYHVGSTVANAPTTIGQTTELSNFTQGLYTARELAMARMQAEAEQLGAEGIVGVDIEESNRIWGSHVIEFLAVGTAVRSSGSRPALPVPDLVLPVES